MIRHALPFSRLWPTHPVGLIRLYPECQQAWDRAKREIKLGSCVLVLPANLHPNEYHYPVEGRDVHVIDLLGVGRDYAIEVGSCLVRAGATLVFFSGPESVSIFFKPEAKE